MPADMKQMIADAVKVLIIEKNKKRITVKDIVEECNITRQAFYYHFADIPDLLQWIIHKHADELKGILAKGLTPEEQIKCWITVYLNMREDLKKTEASNYGEEIKNMIISQIFTTFHECADEEELPIDDFEKDLLIRYHGYAMIGLLSSWTDEDTKNIDRIVHDIYLMLTEQVKKI